MRATQDFIERLSRQGFRYEGRVNKLRGVIQLADGTRREIEISIREGFPYVSPKVRPVGQEVAGPTWHQERDGSLCLWAGDAPIPWSDADMLLDRVRLWFEQSTAGWPDDDPDLDLERYFHRFDAGLVVYRNLEALVGHRLRLSVRGPVIRVAGVFDATKRFPGNVYGGWAANLGQLGRPVYDWRSIEYAFGNTAATVADEIRRGKGHLLLLQYKRGPHTAAIAFHATKGAPVDLRAYEVADESASTLRLRSGTDRATLSQKSVAIIGIGAVGSFLTDMLNRCGVDRLLLQDGQALRPGNSIRHLAGREFVGVNKALAVKQVMAGARHAEMRHVTVASESLILPEDAHRLLIDRDLIVDATASGPITLMLRSLSESTERPFLSICVQREGGVVRCDRWPLRPGESHLPSVPPTDRKSAAREGGCGDPVSLTPPNAVLAAAELACRMAVDLLTESRRLPATVIHVLIPQADPPYNNVALLA